MKAAKWTKKNKKMQKNADKSCKNWNHSGSLKPMRAGNNENNPKQIEYKWKDNNKWNDNNRSWLDCRKHKWWKPEPATIK